MKSSYHGKDNRARKFDEIRQSAIALDREIKNLDEERWRTGDKALIAKIEAAKAKRQDLWIKYGV